MKIKQKNLSTAGNFEREIIMTSVTNRRRGQKKWLPDQDLNLDKLNQNQLCYRYTIGQSVYTAKNGSGSWIRTSDQVVNSHLLYR